MSKKCSMDGIYSDEDRKLRVASTRVLGYPIYAPGERHENLPAGGFAGTPCQSVRFEDPSFERATGSDGQFGRKEARMLRAMRGADFGHDGCGSTYAGLGDFLTDLQSYATQAQNLVQQGQGAVATAQGIYSTIQQAANQSAPPAPAPVAPPSAVSQTIKKVGSVKFMGIPVVVLVALAAGAAFVYIQARKK